MTVYAIDAGRREIVAVWQAGPLVRRVDAPLPEGVDGNRLGRRSRDCRCRLWHLHPPGNCGQ